MDARRTPPDEPLPHGGNLTAARARFPDAPAPWIDLSTGINPFPYPAGVIAASSWSRLPEASAQYALEAAARAAYAAQIEAEVVAAPGTQALLQWLPSVVSTRLPGVAVMTPGGSPLAFWDRLTPNTNDAGERLARKS
jgi:cobalamin biosynthetic protein CobC